MIQEGLGFDLTDIDRFGSFARYPKHILRRVFSDEEIAYCLAESSTNIAERFAVRFALKEAFYKAFCMLGGTRSFFCVCRAVSLQKVPQINLKVRWSVLGMSEQSTVIFSVSHEKNVAGAVVLVKTV